MKRRCIPTLALCLCLLLAGCHTADTTTVPSSAPTIGDPTRGDWSADKEVAFEVLGTCDLTYSVNISQVRYITSADALPNYDALSQYDAAWFETHALLLIWETVPSGKVTVGIEKIDIDGADANITLSHAYDGITGIATNVVRLVWAQVATDLDYDWHITNPALDSDVTDR